MGGEGLVLTAYACATFSVYFTVKVSVKVQVNCVNTRCRFLYEYPEGHVFSSASALYTRMAKY